MEHMGSNYVTYLFLINALINDLSFKTYTIYYRTLEIIKITILNIKTH